MKTTLSPILVLLNEAFERQGAAKSWTTGATIVETVDKDGHKVWWVKQAGTSAVLEDTSDIDALLDRDLLENDGKPVKKRFGSTSEYAVGVYIDELKKLVQEEDSSASRVQVMTRKVKSLERELKQARENNAGEMAMVSLIEELRGAFKLKPSYPAMKFDRSKPSKTRALAGVPTLMLSDWHWGECVDPDQVEGYNEYNLDIANQRADRVFNQTLELLFHHQAGQSYDGFTLILGGDMFSGNIHEELRITNDAPIHDCLISLAEKLADGIVRLAEQFPWVYVPGVVGNHGRIDRKPTAKNAVKDNYDSLLYQIVAMLVRGRMKDRCNVEFDIAKALDMRYALYNTRYLLTHGDQVGGGSGVGGFWPSMMKVADRKQQRSVKTGGGGFDYMVCGHFHKYGNVANVIVNGSLKGYDEWVYKMNFGFELPIQALWTTHPEYGIIRHEPVYAETPVSDMSANVAPVTPSWNKKVLAKV